MCVVGDLQVIGDQRGTAADQTIHGRSGCYQHKRTSADVGKVPTQVVDGTCANGNQNIALHVKGHSYAAHGRLVCREVTDFGAFQYMKFIRDIRIGQGSLHLFAGDGISVGVRQNEWTVIAQLVKKSGKLFDSITFNNIVAEMS